MNSYTEIITRGYHMDIFGHVNNARYLEFLEEERWAQLEANIDLEDWAARGLIFMVVNININYRKAVGPGKRLIVSTGVEKVRRRSMILKQEICLKGSGELVADALVTFVVARKNGGLVAMEGEIKASLMKIGSDQSRPVEPVASG